MDTSTLKQILVEAMTPYAGQGLNAHSHLTANQAESVYTVVDVAQVNGKRIVSTILLVRLAEGKIIIELDRNSKPLVEALKARGVPDEQLVLAYLDDTISA